MVWSGVEERHRFVSTGWGQSPDCRVLSSAGKEASHEWMGLSVLVVGRDGRRERKRERAWLCQPCPSPGSIFPWGLSPSGALESGVR